jgi:hypothetical protein
VPNALRANRAYATRLGQGHHTIIPCHKYILYLYLYLYLSRLDQNWIEILNAYVALV